MLVYAIPDRGKGFTHGITVKVDGEDYYFAGPADGPNGEKDVPGHYWAQGDSAKEIIGKHYNTGPFCMAKWWSSDAPDGELLYVVSAVIDTWTADKAETYAARGFVHYHELVSVATGDLHPTKVVWLKHTARTSFTLDGGPHPEFSHEVTPGIDYEFINNYMMPYSP